MRFCRRESCRRVNRRRDKGGLWLGCEVGPGAGRKRSGGGFVVAKMGKKRASHRTRTSTIWEVALGSMEGQIFGLFSPNSLLAPCCGGFFRAGSAVVLPLYLPVPYCLAKLPSQDAEGHVTWIFSGELQSSLARAERLRASSAAIVQLCILGLEHISSPLIPSIQILRDHLIENLPLYFLILFSSSASGTCLWSKLEIADLPVSY